MKNLLVVIPAIKKNAVIPDQLVKKLNGITLIQRAINTAKDLTEKENILVVTDSEEISLICERNEVGFYLDSKLRLNPNEIIKELFEIIKNNIQENILLYRANTPLVDSETLRDAYSEFLNNPSSVLTSVKQGKRKLLAKDCGRLKRIFSAGEEYFEELKAFHIFSRDTVSKSNYDFLPFVIGDEQSIEIASYQNWWVCEKILQRKRIVFNVIGSVEIGMGHIYHSLSLAHEITDHEVIFVCDEKYKIVVDKIAATDYRVIATDDTTKTILSLKPEMVINDILNTGEEFIRALKARGIKVVNFEDLGSGSKFADLVFNELYDNPQCEGLNYCWGYKYLALRDEFYEAVPNQFVDEVRAVMISFGGTDQNNLTLRSLKAVIETVKKNRIKVFIVCGGAFGFRKELESYLMQLNYDNIELIFASDVMSKVMEKTNIAISSNGRTVYELADMNIPAIIISHHEREATHTFASLEKGFVNLGVYDEKTSMDILREKFEKLVNDRDYRKLLFLNIRKYNFRENKQKVVRKILELL